MTLGNPGQQTEIGFCGLNERFKGSRPMADFQDRHANAR
jgi:hypothetical protein